MAKGCALSTGYLPRGGLPRKSVDRITDRPDMTSAVDHGRKASTQTKFSVKESRTAHTSYHTNAANTKKIVSVLSGFCAIADELQAEIQQLKLQTLNASGSSHLLESRLQSLESRTGGKSGARGMYSIIKRPSDTGFLKI